METCKAIVQYEYDRLIETGKPHVDSSFVGVALKKQRQRLT